jgi:hypothetical protein
MTIEQLITIVENKIKALYDLQALSVQSGDLAESERLGVEIEQTQSTLELLKR